ncbi:UDP-N-acetylglucosamine--N-acetylmuramyl-(pentapeptide) pyrophosphoryl-undecaprenol N-acetylglucosamine transferase [Streptococcus sp. CSL10205-OR2]|uniref:UDP-N-acetylglucosamine--N-acetylmuramyl- (pentapeptide) pyrophosphoryl-undecaprenol N-acetylglucosamine transferase n=1 Tax=Streptococcus sp. CSL10205-OR2 TaxID=2980558 RepID=UPI0021D88A31|nr:UDP-N-acetylglucosamine--N-acetylmuramyl-(pentapeptide) pyrophosphoryl-undecaprenol N-acetylglucosamine transferase [Streptococcus sp. CSL10205-OR2]MCU9533461.1 UDP-N-acetylglucosamine--N-acetylmuramyl-(pentapeptide) pyrophosphoryl-undecaprenol N-acetylglucosamine transferase [Streptococcus sp. CSL10205-OR2]
MTKPKIVLTGGGTVGHVTLNLLLIPQLIKDGFEVHYIGDKNGVEFEQLQPFKNQVTFHSIATGKLRRYFSWQNLADFFKVFWGILQSVVILLRIKPKALFSKGGFVSVPPVMASKLIGIPIFVHESDLSMGLANKIAYKLATLMYTTFEQEHQSVKLKHVGAITKISQETQISPSQLVTEVKEMFSPDLKTLLFIGGSAGARVFNDFITAHQEELTKHYNIINISGDKTLNQLKKNLYRIDYVTDTYQSLMAMADLVVTRGGSNTIFELLAMKKPHLIIPLGKEASRGDQLENASYFENKGYALQLAENQLSEKTFYEQVEFLLAHQETFVETMKASNETTSVEDFYHILMQDISEKTKGR